MTERESRLNHNKGLIFININDIVPYENNPRHNDGAVDAVAASIKEFGFKVPIIVDANNVIVAGHTRLKAAKKLGLEEVPVIVADDLTDEQIKAFRLADNKVGELAEWDMEKLELELQDIDLDMTEFGFEFEPTASEDDFDLEEEVEKIDEPVAQRGDIYRLGDHKLMCGDSTSMDDVKQLMADEMADCLVTDPPYGVSLGDKYANMMNKRTDNLSIENDNLRDDELSEFLSKAFECASKSLKAGGAFYIWCASMTIPQFVEACLKTNLTPRQLLIWVKSAITFTRQDYQWKHEPCLYGWKDGGAHYFIDDRTQATVIDNKPNINKMDKNELRDYVRELWETTDKIGTVIYEAKPTISSEHPTMKPIKLMSRNILNSTQKGELILDLFGGSGSTLIACEQLDRRCNMMEFDPKYCDVIIARWEKLTGQKAVKLNK